MTFEEAMKYPNKGYILKQKEFLYQAYIDYFKTRNNNENKCECDNCIMIYDVCDMCFNNEPLNIQTWLLVLGMLVDSEQLMNIWLNGELAEAS